MTSARTAGSTPISPSEPRALGLRARAACARDLSRRFRDGGRCRQTAVRLTATPAMTSRSLRERVPNAPHTLRDYSLIADGRRGAIIGPRGDIAWLCFPRWDSPSVFDTLLGGSAAYNLHPEEPYVWGGYYEDRNLDLAGPLGHVLRSHRRVPRSSCVPWGFASSSRASPSPLCRRSSAAPDLPAPEVRVRGAPLPVVAPTRGRGRGSPGAQVCVCDGQARPPPPHDHGATHPGSSRRSSWRRGSIAISCWRSPPWLCLLICPIPSTCWLTTKSTWKAFTPVSAATLTPRDARQAFAVLRGMTSPDGGTVAAVTTSLPERADQGRNYDYRYSWIRDQCFIGGAAAAAGEGLELMDTSVAFVTARLLEDGPGLAPAYTVDGGLVPAESCLGFSGVSRWQCRRRQPRGQAVPARRLRRSTRPPRPSGSAERPRRRGVACGQDGRGRYRRSLAGSGRWDLGARQQAMDAQPLGVCGRHPGDLRSWGSGLGDRGMDVAGRRDHGRHSQDLCPFEWTLATSTRRRSSRRRRWSCPACTALRPATTRGRC